MKTLIASILALSVLGATAADAAIHIGIGVGHRYHHHEVCSWRFHHRFCHWI